MANNSKKIVIKQISEIVPYVNNPRNNKEAVDLVAASISEFGFKNPIILDKNNVIIAGHTRYKAAQKLGLTEVPCLIADDLTPAQVKAFRLADNKVAEAAEWNMDMLKIELEGIEDIDMSDFGFDIDLGDEEEPDIKEDDVPETPTEPKSKPGDIYRLGRHRLICGDSTDVNIIDRLMGGKKANLVVTDPPYNVAVGSKNKVLNECNHEKRGNRIEIDIAGDAEMSDEECGQKLWRPAFFTMYEHADDKCAIYCFMPQGGTHMMMMMAMRDAGWQVKHELIWVKNQQTFSMGRLDYEYRHEPILYGWKKGHNFYAKNTCNSILEEDKPQKSDLHPTMKPISLLARLINNSSKPGELVLDAFGGSGSTLIACEQLNRCCYMCEIDPHFVDVIIERWEKLTGEKAELISEG